MERALASIVAIDDPIKAAAVLASRLARAQGFAEGNKRTALLLARWVLDRNDVDGSRVIPVDDVVFVRAASGHDVEAAIVELLEGRR